MAEPGLDPLSDLTHQIIKSGAYDMLIAPSHAPSSAAVLAKVTPAELLTVPIRSQPDADAMLSGLWLLHDALDESHTISQSLHNSSGSFWHAIMHRREGDFSNSKYWFARCADHPVLKSMGSYANDILHPLPADKSLLRLVRSGWDPSAFVDLAEAVHNVPDDARYRPAVALQKIEWRLLFNYCTRLAAGQ